MTFGGIHRAGLGAAFLALTALAGCGPGDSGKPDLAIGGGSTFGPVAGLDAADQQRVDQARQQALDMQGSGKSVAWSNPANPGRFGSAAAGPVSTQGGQACRPFSQTVYIDGVPQVSRGVACKGAGGAWRSKSA